MHGLAHNNFNIAMISLPQGELRFVDTSNPSLIACTKERNVLSLWPESEHTLLRSRLTKRLKLSEPYIQEISNSQLATTFKVIPIMQDDVVCAYLWCLNCTKPNKCNNTHCLDSSIYDPIQPQWVIDMEVILGYLKQLSIKNADDIIHYMKREADFIPSITYLMNIYSANPAFYALLNTTESNNNLNELFRSFLSDQDIFHYCCALLNTLVSNNTYSYITYLNKPKATEEEEKNKTLCIYITPLTSSSSPTTLHMHAIDITAYPIKQLSDFTNDTNIYSHLFNTVSDFFFIYDFKSDKALSYNITKQSFSYEKCAGFDEIDMGCTNLKPQFLKFMQCFDIKDVHLALKKTDTYTYNCQFTDTNNQYRYFNCQSKVLCKTPAGEILHAVFLTRDITELIQTRQALAKQEERYSLLAENFSDIIITLNTDFAIDYVSRSSQSLLGFDGKTLFSHKKVFSILGLQHHQELIEHKFRQSLHNLKKEEQALEEEHALDEIIETVGTTFNGKQIPLEFKISLIRSNENKIEGLLIIGQDLSDKKAIQANKQLALQVFENSLDAIYITNTEGLIVQANQSFFQITRYKKQDILNKKPSILSSGWYDISFNQDIKPALTKQQYWEGELLSRRADGEAFLALIRVTALYNTKKELSGLITSFKDITEAKNSEESIKKLAYFDPLTELPNRSLFDDRLYQALQRGSRNRLYVAILFLDLDGFKAVNDKLGHANGDRLLTEVGKRLKHTIRSDDTVARMGGDEFTIILNALPNREMAENATGQIAEKIVNAISKAFIINNHPVKIGCSIGISLYPDDSVTPDELLKQADTAMYHVKQSGKNGFQFYTTDMSERTKRRHELEKDLLSASFNDEFTLIFQPVFHAQEQHLAALEALIQWVHPKRGLIKGNVFLPMAEDLGIGIKLGQWIIDQACYALKQSLQQNTNELRLSVTVFERHYLEGDLVNTVKNSLSQHAIPANLLTLEIAQDILMNDTGYAYAILSDLKALGIRLSINNFATSLTSLQSINRLAIDQIKINHQFTQYLNETSENMRLVKGVMAMATSWGYDVIAEGIKSSEQLNHLLICSADMSKDSLYFSQLKPSNNLLDLIKVSRPLLK